MGAIDWPQNSLGLTSDLCLIGDINYYIVQEVKIYENIQFTLLNSMPHKDWKVSLMLATATKTPEPNTEETNLTIYHKLLEPSKPQPQDFQGLLCYLKDVSGQCLNVR